MRIVLYGINGLYNYGCEAMVRGISERLAEAYSDSEIVYKTRCYEQDSAVLSDCSTVAVEPIEKKINPIHKKAIRFFRRKMGFSKPEDNLYFDVDWTKSCDLLIIIGGDVFDLTPSQKNKSKYLNDRIFVSQLVKRNGGKVALWGISVGDFESNLPAKKTLLNYFKQTVDIALIRDQKSYDYLIRNGVKNIYLCADPAYMQRTIQRSTSDTDKRIMGVNLSPLANRYLNFEKSQEQWIALWSERLIEIFSKNHFDAIMLIPHVSCSDNPSDDDVWYLKKVYEELKKRNIEVSMAPANVGFLGIKKYITECSVLFAARMHCAVNGITCGVPTIFLSYSPKSVGMCRYVYGNEKFVLDMNQLTVEVPDNITEIVNEVSKLQDYLQETNLKLYDKACNAIKRIKKE